MSPIQANLVVSEPSVEGASSEAFNASSEDQRGDGQVPDLASYLPMNASDETDDASHQHDAGDITVEHLDSDLPNGTGVPMDDYEPPEDPSATHTTVISKEEIEALSQAASNQLRSEVAGSQRQNANGRLPKLKDSKLNMPTRNRNSLPASDELKQRRLRRGPGLRPSPYDIEADETPLHPTVFLSRADRLPEISPLRRQKKSKTSRVLQSTADIEHDVVEADVEASRDIPAITGPRRSPQEHGARPEVGKTQHARGSQPQPVGVATSPRRAPGRPRKAKGPSKLVPRPFKETGDSEEPPQVEETHDEQAIKISQVKPVIQRARLSEVYSRNAPGLRLESEDESSKSANDARSADRPRKRKRGQASSVNHVAKKSKQGRRQPTEDEQPSEPEERLFAGSLLGQWNCLKNLRRNSRKVGDEEAREEIKQDDIDVATVLSWTTRARRKLLRLRDDGENTGDLADPSKELESIARKIGGLCGHDPQSPADFDDQGKSENIHLYLIPAMIRFLVFSAECYMAVNRAESTSTVSVTIDHLRVLTKLAGLIVKLGAVAEKKYTRPRPQFAIIDPVHKGLIIPLRSVRAAFSRHVGQYDSDQIRAAERAQRQADDAIRLRNEEALAAASKEGLKLRKKWKELHDERRYVEPLILPFEKQQRLRVVECTPELDRNGELFEREDMFRARIGPPPAMVDEARRRQWRDEEVAALADGLRRFAGPMVFEKIFRQHCIQFGLLNRFNVTEIVTIAADAKNWLETQQMEEMGEVEEWVKTIPVWTAPHVLVGKENGGDEEEVE